MDNVEILTTFGTKDTGRGQTNHKRHRTRTNKSQKTQDEDKQITKTHPSHDHDF